MARNVDLSSIEVEAAYILEKYKFVLSKFPDCKLQKVIPGYLTKDPVFVSKMVNQSYTHLDFVKDSRRVVVVPHCKLEFEFGGKKEDIIVHSSPKRSLLAKVSHLRDKTTRALLKDEKGRYIRSIIFARLAVNLKNNSFDEKMLNECRGAILSFIKENPGYKIDDKHLEPRLKKLLVFT